MLRELDENFGGGFAIGARDLGRVSEPYQGNHGFQRRVYRDQVEEAGGAGDGARVPFTPDTFAPQIQTHVLKCATAGRIIFTGTDRIVGIFAGEYQPTWNLAPAPKLGLPGLSTLSLGGQLRV